MSDELPVDAPTLAPLAGMPVLPLRDVVVYPHMVIPLFVGREKSIVALDLAMKADKRILLVAQKQADVDDPKGDDLYRVGTVATILQLLHARAIDAFHQHFDRTVGQLQQLQNRRNRPDQVQIGGLRIIDIRLFLRHEQDALVGLHGHVEGHDGLLPADEQRDHHVRIHDDIAQRQHGHAARRGNHGRGINDFFVAH